MQGPTWWHPSGRKLRLVTERSMLTGQPDILLTSEAMRAQVTINKENRSKNFVYLVAWRVIHETFFAEAWTGGCIRLTPEQLRQAFGAGESLELPGKCIRYGAYLNIPGPGTGKDGDPNISIYITDEIHSAVEALLRRDVPQAA